MRAISSAGCSFLAGSSGYNGGVDETEGVPNDTRGEVNAAEGVDIEEAGEEADEEADEEAGEEADEGEFGMPDPSLNPSLHPSHNPSLNPLAVLISLMSESVSLAHSGNPDRSIAMVSPCNVRPLPVLPRGAGFGTAGVISKAFPCSGMVAILLVLTCSTFFFTLLFNFC
jgi:hypothetical protein